MTAMPTDSHSQRAEVEALTGVIRRQLRERFGSWSALDPVMVALDELDAHVVVPSATPSPDAGIDVERQRWAEWISEMGTALDAHDQGDWACAECRPTSDMLVPGFRCVVHEARAYLAGAPAGDAK